MRIIPRDKFSYDELPEGRVYYSKGLRSETPLRAMRNFLEALYFSLYNYSHLVIRLAKNKALEESFRSNGGLPA